MANIQNTFSAKLPYTYMNESDVPLISRSGKKQIANEVDITIPKEHVKLHFTRFLHVATL